MLNLPVINDIVLLPRFTEMCGANGSAGFEYTTEPREYTVGFVTEVDEVNSTATIRFARETLSYHIFNWMVYLIQAEDVLEVPVADFELFSVTTPEEQEFLDVLLERKHIIDTEGYRQFAVWNDTSYDPAAGNHGLKIKPRN